MAQDREGFWSQSNLVPVNKQATAIQIQDATIELQSLCLHLHIVLYAILTNNPGSAPAFSRTARNLISVHRPAAANITDASRGMPPSMSGSGSSAECSEGSNDFRSATLRWGNRPAGCG